MKKAEFFKLCEVHDWFYMRAEDYKVYKAGEINETKLKKIAKELNFVGIYDSWKNYAFSGSAFGCEQTPRPQITDFQ